MSFDTKYLISLNSSELLMKNIKEISTDILDNLELDYLSLYSIKVNPIYSTFVPITSKYKSFNLDVNKNLLSINDFMKKFSNELISFFKNDYMKDYKNFVGFDELNSKFNIDQYPGFSIMRNTHLLPFYFDSELYALLVLTKDYDLKFSQEIFAKIEVLCILAKIYYFKSKSVDLVKIENNSIIKYDLIEFYSEVLRKISNNLPGFIYKLEATSDDRMFMTYASEKIEEVYGLSFEDVNEDIAKIYDIVHPDDKMFLYDSIQESKRNLTIWKQVYRVILNGKIKWISSEATPERDLNGSVIWYGYITDVSEIQKLQMQLEESEAYKNAILNAVNKSVLVSVADLKAKIIDVNEAFITISGFSRNELIGSDHNIVNSKHHDKDFWINMWKTISKGVSWRERIKNKTKDGDYYWVDTVINPILDKNGKIQEYLSIRYDITKQVLLEEEMRNSNKTLTQKLNKQTKVLKENIKEIKIQNEELFQKQLELNNAMQVKEQFLNIMAHDIKNNLTSISLISSMLTNYWDKLKEDEKIKKLNDINKSTHLLDEFLKELLLWSKTHSGNISFSPKKQDIIPVINNLLAIFKLNPENAKKTCDFNPNQEVIFEFDLNILSTVIRNLITNSIKFTDSNGLISIRFEQTFSDISIIVEDNGIGMTPNELDILMDLTKSKKKINNSKNKGTGLGVNLCIELVKIHSGTIKIESEQNKGTKTIITLPKYY